MNKVYALILDEKVDNIIIGNPPPDIKSVNVESFRDIDIGDTYWNGLFFDSNGGLRLYKVDRNNIDESSKIIRESLYTSLRYSALNEPLLLWEGKDLTIDEAVKIWTNYSAENNTKALEIQSKIGPAKEKIRQLYPGVRSVIVEPEAVTE